MFKLIINCGLAEDFIGTCLESIKRQSVTDWEAYVTCDRRGDATYERAVAARAGDARIRITQNPRRLYTMVNLVRGIERSNAEPEDVVVILDGDDWFVTDHALEIIEDTYDETDCWLTYGSWISNRIDIPGRLPAYPDDTVDFRSARWLGTAVRTWKKWLFDRIDARDFRDARGRLFRVTEDLAVMLPMLEMATTRRARHIAEPLMLYNRLSHHDPGRRLAEEAIRNAEWLRAGHRYAPLAGEGLRTEDSGLRTEDSGLSVPSDAAAPPSTSVLSPHSSVLSQTFESSRL